MRDRAPRALIYGGADLNALDGSTIWVPAAAEAFARAGCKVSLLLMTPVKTGRLIEPLEALPAVRLIRPFEDGLAPRDAANRLTPSQASEIMRDLDTEDRFDLVVLRGFELICRVVDDGRFAGRVWPYLTDIPQSVEGMDPEHLGRLTDIALASRFLLCQTEELRCFLEGLVPAACGRSVVFAPIVPVPDFALPPPRQAPSRPVKLIYSGKFAPLWNTLPMTELPARLADRGIPAELHAIGEKVVVDRDDLPYRARMIRALRSTPHVTWHGGQSRQEAMRLAAGGDFGLGWRDRSMDASLELSTKVLEYGAVGLPAVLNRTPMHEALLGVDYPLFARTQDEVVQAIAYAVERPAAYAEAAARCVVAARRFAMPEAALRVGHLLDVAFPASLPTAERGRPLRVVVAGHDLRFFRGILDHLRAVPGIELRIDQWADLAVHDETASLQHVAWADVVICEWFAPNALWYSAHRRPEQRLIVHLHRFELYRPWPGKAAIDLIDQVVCVSPHYARVALQRTGWPSTKVTVVPNYVDVDQLDRPKLEGAAVHLGMIGIVPSLKRMDLALDVLAILRRDDPRYHLFIKGKLPWEHPGIWDVPAERIAFDEVLRRLQVDRALRGAVTFDGFGPDVPAWLRRIGWVLSTSDGESFHLAPADGMASGAVPVVRDWPGADTIYDARWIRHDPDAMAEMIASIAAEGRWEAEGERAKAEVQERYSLERVADPWTRILEANLPGTVVDPTEPMVVDAFAEPVTAGPATP